MSFENTNRWVTKEAVLLSLEERGVHLPEHIALEQIERALKDVYAVGVTTYVVAVEVIDGKFYVPCNCYSIISFRTLINDSKFVFRFNPVTRYTSPEEIASKKIDRAFRDENYVENVGTLTRGKVVPFRWQDDVDENGNFAWTNQKSGIFLLEYSGVKVDKSGFPMIPEDCKEFCYWFVKRFNDEALFYSDQLTAAKLQYTVSRMEEEKMKAKPGFTKNDIEEALKVMHSWNRSNYWRLS